MPQSESSRETSRIGVSLLFPERPIRVRERTDFHALMARHARRASKPAIPSPKAGAVAG
jgi:hypothetical protein